MPPADDPPEPKKVEYLPPERTRGSYRPPGTQENVPLLRPFLRLPQDPDVPSSGWFDAARIESKRLRVLRRQQLWNAFTDYLRQYRECLGELEQYQRALNRARKIQRIIDNDDAEFNLEMEANEREREQIRKRWAEEDGGRAAERAAERREDDMAQHRQAIHDMFMQPLKIRSESETFIQEFVQKRGGEDNLTDNDKEDIKNFCEQVEEYIASLKERGE